MSVIKKINVMIDEMSNSERKVAEYICQFPEQVTMLTTTELANLADTSAAAVIRMLKKIGLTSFSEMKMALSLEISKGVEEGYSDITGSESLEDIKYKLLGNSYQTMLDTVENIEGKMISQAIEIIKQAPVIYLYGVGASKLVAINLQQKFSRIGKIVIFEEDFHSLLPMIISSSPDNLFIGISNSGENDEVIKLLNHAKNNQLKRIGVSKFGKHRLNELVDINLQIMKPNEATIRSGATTSLHAYYILIDILFFMYMNTDFEGNYQLIKRSFEVGKGNY
ncbi:MurR/RpiR family transcriptional regulator [Vagococcus zengguangii]|uniref:MurR/RpiR family transcriptional regulator n=1 Tax=Vagococcus zengguangii TaxID=2571750 RepID=A0A4D7CNZ1_9ENTE|nr:MurR/RpiR family transcriptional regulator [Vagococcus zengguangii]QCI85788.1 MurR/RpiR family transcriptional regulator [Vagococcus zengguangii]TLG81729.1 MurR/RpiR family transcriptional regulator [Vagococcus zengguangii]